MTLKTDAYYRDLVADILTRAGIDEPPVNLERVAESLHVPIRLVRLPAFFHGALLAEGGLPVIMLNVSPTDEQRKIALAHVLAHLILVVSDPEEGYPRDTRHEHVEADKVAQELILPYRMVIEQSQLWFNDYRYLARLFGVDEQAILGRMREAGIMLNAGIMWDY